MGIGKRNIEGARITSPPQNRDELIREVEGDFNRAFDKSRSFGDRLSAFVKGENKAGRKVGKVLDFLTVFAPVGVKTARDAAQTIINRKEKTPMKHAIKRALTGDGGGFIKVRNENGDIDITAIGATLIRVGIIIGVLYAGKALGIMDHLMSILNL